MVLHKKFVQKCVFIYHILSYTDPIFETSLEKQLIKKCSPNAMHILVFFSAKRDNSNQWKMIDPLRSNNLIVVVEIFETASNAG